MVARGSGEWSQWKFHNLGHRILAWPELYYITSKQNWIAGCLLVRRIFFRKARQNVVQTMRATHVTVQERSGRS